MNDGKIETSIAARILGWHVNTVLKWIYNGKIKSAERKLNRRGSTWRCDREEIIQIKNAN